MIDRFLRLIIPKMYHGYGNPPTFLVNISDYGVDINGPARIYLHKTISDEQIYAGRAVETGPCFQNTVFTLIVSSSRTSSSTRTVSRDVNIVTLFSIAHLRSATPSS